jgi:hypothetical protein
VLEHAGDRSRSIAGPPSRTTLPARSPRRILNDADREIDVREFSKAEFPQFEGGPADRAIQHGIGEGSAVDPVRAARFRARIANEGDTAAKSAKDAGKRLRLARRMAGYGSVAAAAETLKLNRSTLSAHEVGQNTMSAQVGRLYAAAFNCSAEWLMH